MEWEVDVLSVESWDNWSSYKHRNQSRWSALVQYGAPYASPSSTAQAFASAYAKNNTYIGVGKQPLYNPGWTFWAMPFGCMDTMDAIDLGNGRMMHSRTSSNGCEGFYIDKDGYAINREYMVPAYNMSDYYQIFPTWSDGANVAGYRRDKVSPVSFLPSARLGHYREWTYEPPEFIFRPGPTIKRLVIIFHWDFSPRTNYVGI